MDDLNSYVKVDIIASRIASMEVMYSFQYTIYAHIPTHLIKYFNLRLNHYREIANRLGMNSKT